MYSHFITLSIYHGGYSVHCNRCTFLMMIKKLKSTTNTSKLYSSKVAACHYSDLLQNAYAT